jgi:hypothetical protein
MRHEEVMASVAVLVLAGVLVYLTKIGVLAVGGAVNKDAMRAANQMSAAADIGGAGGDPSAFVYGPAIYMANTPWLFSPPGGNTIPPTGSQTLPGAGPTDFLGFISTGT